MCENDIISSKMEKTICIYMMKFISFHTKIAYNRGYSKSINFLFKNRAAL